MVQQFLFKVQPESWKIPASFFREVHLVDLLTFGNSLGFTYRGGSFRSDNFLENVMDPTLTAASFF